jgi:hypothetical protein
MTDLTGLLVEVVVIFVLGASFLVEWRWPRRKGEAPHCAKCDYNLTGLQSDRCPECGTPIDSRSTPRGEPQRKRWLVYAAIACWLWGGFEVYRFVRQGNLYQSYPLSWVFQDAEFASGARSGRGWDELRRRQDESALSPGQQAELDALCARYIRSSKPAGAHTSWRMLTKRVKDTALAREAVNALFQTCIEQLGMDSPPAPDEAWMVVEMFIVDSQLSSSQQSQVVALCLSQQPFDKARSWNRPMVDYLEKLYRAGKLSAAEQETFFQQMVGFELLARKKVVLGDPVPVRLDIRRRGLIGFRVEFCPADDERMTDMLLPYLDGKLISGGPRMPTRINDLRSIDSGYREHISHQLALECDVAGQHTVELALTVRVRERFAGQAGGEAKLCHQRQIRLSAGFEVLGEEPADYIRQINDSSLRRALAECIRCKTDRFDAGRGQHLWITVEIDKPPVGVAFEVFAQFEGMELRMGEVHAARGESVHRFLSAESGRPAPERCSVIFRSSEKVARNTVDLVEMWAGEIVLPQVPVSEFLPSVFLPAATVPSRASASQPSTKP